MSAVNDHFYVISDPPAEVRGATAIARMVDGLGFRYRWSLEGVDERFLDYRPVAEAMNVRELLLHIHFLATHIHACFVDQEEIKCEASSLYGIKHETRAILHKVRETLVRMSDEELAVKRVIRKAGHAEFPFWFFINGPLADALTHVGQISSWRRMAGYMPVKADVFNGKPPVEVEK